MSFLLFSSGCEERCFLLMCRWHMLVILFHYVLVALFCCRCFSFFSFFASVTEEILFFLNFPLAPWMYYYPCHVMASFFFSSSSLQKL